MEGTHGEGQNEKNEWDQITNVDVVKGSIEKVTVGEVMTAL